jgi:hypothetical protein
VDSTPMWGFFEFNQKDGLMWVYFASGPCELLLKNLIIFGPFFFNIIF